MRLMKRAVCAYLSLNDNISKIIILKIKTIVHGRTFVRTCFKSEIHDILSHFLHVKNTRVPLS